jgi:hypothetical protein
VSALSPTELLQQAPDRLTIAGDWHADGAWARTVIRAAAEAGSGVLLHLGDFGIWPGEFGRTYLDTVERALAETGVTLAFIDGNHEDFPQLLATPVEPLDDGTPGLRAVRPGLYHLPRGTRWTWGDLRWLALGGAASVDRAWRKPGISWWPEETLTSGDVRRASESGEVDVMLTHDCPAGVAIPGFGPPPDGSGPPKPPPWPVDALAAAHANRMLLREVVDAVTPTQLFHGHFHVAYTAELPLAGDRFVAVRGLGREPDPGNVLHTDLATLSRQTHDHPTV